MFNFFILGRQLSPAVGKPFTTWICWGQMITATWAVISNMKKTPEN